MVKVLFVLTSHEKGFYLPEIAHPFFVFKRAGYDIHIASINGGFARVAPQSIDLTDYDNADFFNDPSHYERVKESLSLDSFNPADFDVVFYVGGYGTMFDFPENEVDYLFISFFSFIFWLITMYLVSWKILSEKRL